MKVINTLFLTASLGLAAAPGAWAASTLQFDITPGTGNDATVTWTFGGDWTTTGVIAIDIYTSTTSVNTFQFTPSPGLFNSHGEYSSSMSGGGSLVNTTADHLASALFSSFNMGSTRIPMSSGYSESIAMGLVAGLPVIAGDAIKYESGSVNSGVMPNCFSAFNPGTYTGSISGFFTTPIDVTVNVSSLSAVPEPSEWAAISFGLLGVVWVAKRRFMPARA